MIFALDDDGIQRTYIREQKEESALADSSFCS